jgi:hypothetical protein
MSLSHSKSTRTAALTILTTILSVTALFAQPVTNTNDPPGLGISSESRAKLDAAVLQHPKVVALAGGQRVRVLGLRATETTKDENQTSPESLSAELFLVKYTDNKGIRVRVNVETLAVQDVIETKGRPQSSGEEQKEAQELIGRDTKLGKLLRAGSRAVGGFVVDPPIGTPREGRYLEYHIASADGRQLQHKVFVNLASSRLYVDAAKNIDAHKH